MNVITDNGTNSTLARFGIAVSLSAASISGGNTISRNAGTGVIAGTGATVLLRVTRLRDSLRPTRNSAGPNRATAALVSNGHRGPSASVTRRARGRLVLSEPFALDGNVDEPLALGIGG